MSSRLRQNFRGILDSEAVSSLGSDLQELIPDFCMAIKHGNDQKLKEVFDKGFPVNFPFISGTALHSLAAGRARPAIRVLLTYEDVNFIARDFKGRLPSELAYTVGHDPALARLLGNKERKQAAAEGIKLTRRPSL